MACLLARYHRRTIAAAVEGEDEVVLLHAALRRGRNCGLPKGVLGVAQRLALPDVRQPFAVAFQPDGRLWAAGVPAIPNADNRGMVLGAADRVNGDAADAHQPEVMPRCVSCHCRATSEVGSLWHAKCPYHERMGSTVIL